MHPSLYPVETETKLSTLIDLLRLRSFNEPKLTAYRFLAGAENETDVTYGELDLRARAVATLLESRNLTGERVLLLYPPGLDFISAFFGCLYAGTVAVPASLPRTKRGLARLRTIIDDAEAAGVLTTQQVFSRLESLKDSDASLEWLTTDSVATDFATDWREPLLNSDDLAYLQYTSGSTATPKGVMITHGNVLDNSAYIRLGFEHGPQSVSLSWLPHFHDMGLVDGIIQPLYSGFTGLLMPPTTLLQNPARWLQAISRYEVTHSGGPNFAYDLCVRRIDEAARASLDLSSWSVAYNGAEPVRHETIERFSATFASCGFRRESFYPAYGLAEATLKVTGGKRSCGPRFCTVETSALAQHRVVKTSGPGSRTLVGCGRAAEGTEIVIVDPESFARCAPDEVGEVWVAGPGVAAGYWNRPDKTAQTFQARLDGGKRFLRTGDLGFVLDDELYIAGRLKDLVIIRGRNHYPQDIESVMRQGNGDGAAFSLEIDGEERLVVVQEIESRLKTEVTAIIDTIRATIAEEFEIQPAAVVLIKSGTLPKTSSGKVRRAACREDFLTDRLRVIAEWRVAAVADRVAPVVPAELNAESVARWLSLLLSARLNTEVSELNGSIRRYGIDSLLALELTHDVETSLGVTISLTSFLRDRTVTDLTNEILIKLSQSQPASSTGNVYEGEFALSHNQQALWAVQQVSPDSPAYSVSIAARINSEMNFDSLRLAFDALLKRHPMLRTTFHSRQGAPVCVVQEHAEIFFRVVDATDWAEEKLRERLNDEVRSTFDLENGPLLRVKVFERSTHDYALLLSAHHLIVDFWSLAILFRELGEFYRDLESRATTPVPYSDYVSWQEKLLRSPEGERLRNYWLQQLAGELPVLDLQTDRARPTVQTYCGSSDLSKLDRQLVEQLKALAASHEATLFMTLLAAFQVLLHRYAGQEDVLIGSPSSGRGLAKFAGTVGYFVNPIVLRGFIPRDKTFTQLLVETRQTALAAFEHQDYPFDLLVKELRPERDPGRSALFQTMFAFQQTHDEGLSAFALGESGVELKLGTLPLETFALDQRAAQFDLSLTMAEVDRELLASFEYNTDLFDAVTIERLSEHFQILLRGIVDDPHTTVAKLPLLSHAEKQQILYDWNNTHVTFESLTYVHELFTQQAARTPDQIAVISARGTWNYRELNERANRLAHYLRALGVGPEVIVAICVSRSAAMLACVFGVLKAGGAYVPLDPSYPRERLRFMLEDSGASLVLTEEKSATELFSSTAAQVVLIDREAIATESGDNPSAIVTPENLAFVIYTSGSTGKPKGVMVPHGSLANFVRAVNIDYKIGPRDRVLQFLPFSFDGHAEEIFVSLANGATLVLRDDEVPKEPVAFLQECRDKKLTIVDLPTTYWSELVAHLNSNDWSSDLRLVIIGGDKAPSQRVERWHATVGQRIRLVNTYGPTEATVVSTMSEAESSIGRPVANTQAYVLDQQLQPIPVGARGELYLGGNDITRGYLGDPVLTSEKFLPDPFNSKPGMRLYRTGDAVRYRRDGQVKFLGRMDHQVKIRGHRVEPSEVESCLLRHEAVRDVAVVVRVEQLVAYVVVDGKTTVSNLRQFLAERLPRHLMPASFMLLRELPRLPNGKIDRRALPILEVQEFAEIYIAPRSEVERVLCGIWAEVLKLERVGVSDNFFELGGDSILGIQVAARARLAGLQMTPAQIFQYPTPRELAVFVGVLSAAHEEEEAGGDVEFTPIQRWFFEQNFSVPEHWNMALLLEPRERLDANVLEQSFTQLLKHHDALRLRFVRELEGWRQFISKVDDDVRTNVHVVDLSKLNPSEQTLETVCDEIQTQLDLANGVLLRAVLFELGPMQRLLIVIHHLVSDGVSWRILLEDLGNVYRQLRRGEVVNLPPKTTSFARWSRLLNEYAQSEQVCGELEYWTSLSAKKVKPLPVDFRDGRNVEADTRTITVSLAVDETQKLLREAMRGYRINDVLLTALLEAFAEWTGERELLIELEGHGREDLFPDVDLSRTVGWFTSAFPVLLKLKSGRTTLPTVQEQLRSVLRNGIGYGLLRYLNRRGAADGGTPLRCSDATMIQPEVSFNYLGQLDQVLNDSALFAAAHGSSGRTRDGSASRSQLLEINSFVIEGQLKSAWVYSTAVHKEETIASLAQSFVDALRTIIREQSSEDGVENFYPLSPLQQGLLFHSLYNPGSTIYTGQISFILEGELDVEAFTRAWRRAGERHAILRTAFNWENLEEPLQTINSGAKVWVEQLELPELNHEQRVTEYLEAERRRGFDLTTPPLMRQQLVRVDDKSYRFIWTHHHLLLDGWSIALLLKEIFHDYEALKSGVEEERAAPREYREYIEWLRQQDKARAKSFWSAYLDGFSAPTPLTVDHAPADASREPDTQRLRTTLAKDELNNFARRHGLTLNTVVQGAWALLLSRYGRETDVLYGATVAGRPAGFAGIEQMVGLFINTLPVRVQVRPEMLVSDWLKHIQGEQAASREYEHSPLVELQALSKVPNGTPLFESLLVFENYPLDAATFVRNTSLKVNNIWWFDQTNYPLTLVVTPGAELSLEIFYDAHRFTAHVIERLLGHFQTILKNFTGAASRTVASIPIVTPHEQSILLTEWNDTKQRRGVSPWAPPREQHEFVHQLFEQQALKNPNEIAVVSTSKPLTYRELNERANQLAHYLRRGGVETESRVCICLNPGVEMIVAVLGVLKAGAAYVPLDPAYPESRLRFMLEDSGARVVLTESCLLGDRLSQKTICLDTEKHEIAREPKTNPEIRFDGDNLIYVIYTSGSTGRPKGAGVTHKGFANLTRWFAAEFSLTQNERVLITSSFSFDLTQKDIFTPLTVGARLNFPATTFYDPAAIVETISQNGTTFFNCTPSAFYPLLDVAGPGFEKLASLKHVFLGGEPINPARLRDWASAASFTAEIVNTYGPTECTDTCSSYRLRDFATTAPPIGKPNDNAELFILDEYLNFVPIGIAGELCIGGVGVGRGYLNDAVATAERFIPHPYSSEPGARLYRTGDLARHVRDGNIEFLGRLDHQVKVAGYRIELGEVETALVQHEAVKDCVVVVRTDTHGHARLLAYVTPESCDATTLRRYLADRLPSYMIPSIFVALDRLPLTPGGKVDRRALPAPEMTAAAIECVAPRTAVEEVLAGIWRDVLEVERVGVHDNFLALGGHSLLAMRCVAAMRRLFRIEIPLKVLFETKDLEQLAQALKTYEDQPGRLERIARVWQKIRGTSPEELKNQLRERRAGKSEADSDGGSEK
ncbi:MAG TPA: amino acid adenylation domain-containing protein [Pyrinomonadaceae bacterium]